MNNSHLQKITHQGIPYCQSLCFKLHLIWIQICWNQIYKEGMIIVENVLRDANTSFSITVIHFGLFSTVRHLKHAALWNTMAGLLITARTGNCLNIFFCQHIFVIPIFRSDCYSVYTCRQCDWCQNGVCTTPLRQRLKAAPKKSSLQCPAMQTPHTRPSHWRNFLSRPPCTAVSTLSLSNRAATVQRADSFPVGLVCDPLDRFPLPLIGIQSCSAPHPTPGLLRAAEPRRACTEQCRQQDPPAGASGFNDAFGMWPESENTKDAPSCLECCCPRTCEPAQVRGSVCSHKQS